jgi:hypothetical protein
MKQAIKYALALLGALFHRLKPKRRKREIPDDLFI